MPPDSPPRKPPRFVPTLTERINVGAASSPPFTPSDRASLQEPDGHFAARMAALRDKQSSALNTSDWLVFSERRTARSSVPEHSPKMVAAHGGSNTRENVQISAGAAHAAGDELMEKSGDSPARGEASAVTQAPDGEVLGEHSAPPMSAQQASEFEEMLAHRVLQRVDIALEQQLQKAIAAVVQAHFASLLPKLRDEVGNVVRRAVNEAVSVELASQSQQLQ